VDVQEVAGQVEWLDAVVVDADAVAVAVMDVVREDVQWGGQIIRRRMFST
jgi:hypothetical protein